ncbi:MAG: antitoxin component YwqK of YwqJK toxin-antitoxin module [Candidatus Latescibacterota bacterium]|jgi:antitoxin component YwqK of YwqJK toxin-antitoxin module
MKKFIFILLVVLTVGSITAQECKKACEMTCKKDTFIMNDGLIEATLYHDNGTVAQTGYYTKDNRLQGEWTSYDANGNKTAVGTYDKGVKVGAWSFFRGNDKKEVSYDNSRITEVKTWSLNDTRVVSN